MDWSPSVPAPAAPMPAGAEQSPSGHCLQNYIIWYVRTAEVYLKNAMPVWEHMVKCAHFLIIEKIVALHLLGALRHNILKRSFSDRLAEGRKRCCDLKQVCVL